MLKKSDEYVENFATLEINRNMTIIQTVQIREGLVVKVNKLKGKKKR